jgi:hypothetical protein
VKILTLLLSITALLVVRGSNISANTEISIGTSLQLNISTYDFLYSYCIDGTILYSIGYPVFIGIKYDYQENFQRLAVLSVIRLLPAEWHLKIDIAGGGGLAAINGSPYQYAFFTAGVMPKIFLGDNMMEGPFIYVSVYFMDITTETAAFSFLDGSAGVGYEF